MSKKLATTIYITEQQQAILKELNQRSKVPVAEYIRQGIDLVIQRYRDQLPGQMDLPLGQLDTGRPLERAPSDTTVIFAPKE